MIIDYGSQAGKKMITKGNKKKCIPIESILYIQCEDHLSNIFLNTGEKIPEIQTLCKFEEELSALGFFRIRNNIIINGNYITELDTKINKRTVKLGEIAFIIAKSRLKLFIKSIY
jgi:DNA-binding LytR/AlgR family response regulator